MPVDEVFSVGSFGKDYLNIAKWYGSRAEDLGAKNVCIPFVGLGRIASAICQGDTVLDTCDFQRITTGLIDGVFTAKRWETNVDKPRFRKGWAYNRKFISDSLDERSAGFIDWVAKHGTPLDIMSIGMAIPKQTMRGWMTRWVTDFDSFWADFYEIREACRLYIPRPGVWRYQEADFFKLIEEGGMREPYDLLVVDPPRLSGGFDLYSTAWTRLNIALGGTTKIQSWSHLNYFRLLRKVMEIKSDYVLFSWTDGRAPNPSVIDIKTFALKYGWLEEEVHWRIRDKDIFSWRINRTE